MGSLRFADRATVMAWRLWPRFALCGRAYPSARAGDPMSRNCQPMWGERESGGGSERSLIVRVFTQRIRLKIEPALSLVPLALAPPNGCWPTTAPVGLSLMLKVAAEDRRVSVGPAVAGRGLARGVS